ncbi:hypothetical protein DIS18_03945 [Algibacter marinivivus]|uniref:Uncharacterized protein n=1 Tax=Algibacter marinivivus TaxID=2100723 RepID=A0A2U2X7D5_9FLAO|nr:hypothetical protein DIS18_03945 [Algibacter marinivivus]
MKNWKIILLHFAAFIALSIIWCFSAESVLRNVAPELNYVEIWIKLVIMGIIILFILTLISMILCLVKKRNS